MLSETLICLKVNCMEIMKVLIYYDSRVNT